MHQATCYMHSKGIYGGASSQGWCAGQAVVHFAEDSGGVEYALKFFLDREAFLTEARLYSACGTPLPGIASITSLARPAAPAVQESSGLELPAAAARFLPRIEAVADDCRDPSGAPLPPCIVMEKGESLQDWSNRAEPDLFAAVAVRCAAQYCCACWAGRARCAASVRTCGLKCRRRGAVSVC